MRYRWRTRPYKHQKDAVIKALGLIKDGSQPAFLMEPRTGKTKTTIDTLSILSVRDGLRRVVIVCPNRVIGTWIEEFATHCPLVYQTIVWDAKARKSPLPPHTGHYDLQVVIVNYEAFATPGTIIGKDKHGRPKRSRSRGGRWDTRKFLRKWMKGHDTACVLDESHKIKNSSSSAASMLITMRDDFRYRFILTGTPVTKAKRAHDVYMQWKFLDPSVFSEWGTLEDFKNATGRWIDKNGYPQWVGERAAGMDKLKGKIHHYGVVVRRDDCFDIPKVQMDIRKITLGPSAKVYDQMAEEMVAKLESGEIAEASIPLVVTLRLLQITSGFVGIREPGFARGRPTMITRPVRVGFEKLNAFEDILKEEIIEFEQKTIVAARFNFDMDAIVALCEAYNVPVFQVRGKVKPSVADESRRIFQRMDGPAVFVIQPNAGSLGIDLRTAVRTIWYSLTPSWVDYSQTNDRNALHPHSRIMTYLLADAPVDTELYETLQLDGDLSRHLMKKPQMLLRRQR
jgi:hypothetical protein